MREFFKRMFKRFAFGRLYYGLTDSRVSDLRKHEPVLSFQRILRANSDPSGK